MEHTKTNYSLSNVFFVISTFCNKKLPFERNISWNSMRSLYPSNRDSSNGERVRIVNRAQLPLNRCPQKLHDPLPPRWPPLCWVFAPTDLVVTLFISICGIFLNRIRNDRQHIVPTNAKSPCPGPCKTDLSAGRFIRRHDVICSQRGGE